jgi:hypothetical protein
MSIIDSVTKDGSGGQCEFSVYAKKGLEYFHIPTGLCGVKKRFGRGFIFPALFRSITF